MIAEDRTSRFESPKRSRLRRNGVAWSILVIVALGGCRSDRGGSDSADTPPDLASQWSVALPEAAGAPLVATRVGETVVVQGRDGLVGLSSDTGEPRWLVPAPLGPGGPEPDTAYVTDDAVVTVAGDGREGATVYDVRTGQRRFDVAGPPPGDTQLLGVVTGAVLVGRCPGINSPCSLSARRLSDGSVAWDQRLDLTAVDRIVQSRVRRAVLMPEPLDRTLGTAIDNSRSAGDLIDPLRPAQPGLVVVRGGLSGRTAGRAVPAVTLDAGSGRVVARWQADGLNETDGEASVDRVSFYVGDILLDAPGPSAGGGVARGFDVRSGKVLWTMPVTGRSYAGGHVTTHDYRPAVVDSTGEPLLLQLTGDDQPQVVDLRTGREWRGPAGLILLGAADGVAVARSEGGRGDFVAFDVATGETRWMAPLAKDRLGNPYNLTGWAVTDNRLVYTGTAGVVGEGEELRVVDLDSGKTSGGVDGTSGVLGVGDDWLLASSRSQGGPMISLYMTGP